VAPLGWRHLKLDHSVMNFLRKQDGPVVPT
jgi:hypothetical protein